jgi:hypothetical protein
MALRSRLASLTIAGACCLQVAACYSIHACPDPGIDPSRVSAVEVSPATPCLSLRFAIEPPLPACSTSNTWELTGENGCSETLTIEHGTYTAPQADGSTLLSFPPRSAITLGALAAFGGGPHMDVYEFPARVGERAITISITVPGGGTNFVE